MYTYKYIYLYIHTYIFIYIYMCVCVYVCPDTGPMCMNHLGQTGCYLKPFRRPKNRMGEFFQIGVPQYTAKNILIFIMGTPEIDP